MEENNLVGTVKYYRRHVVVLTETSDWPERIESSSKFISKLKTAIAENHKLDSVLKVTAATGNKAVKGNDILIFPDMVRYSGVGSDDIESDVNHLVNDQLINGKVSSSLSSSRFSGKHIFVCTHAARDERCGIYGPGMITKLSEQLIKQGHEDVTVYSASHVGGHKFAGCLLAYPEGDWYGLLNADLMENFVDQCLTKNEILQNYWRGRMGAHPEEQISISKNWK